VSDESPEQPSRAFVAVISAVMIATAVRLFYAGVTPRPGSHSPAWVLAVLGLVFLAGGTHALLVAFGRRGNGIWVAFIFFAGIAAAFWWIAIASDPRECSAAIFIFPLPGTVCKIGFGFFAAFSTGLAIHIARRLFPRTGPRSYY
jgi:hypothetical protein